MKICWPPWRETGIRGWLRQERRKLELLSEICQCFIKLKNEMFCVIITIFCNSSLSISLSLYISIYTYHIQQDYIYNGMVINRRSSFATDLVYLSSSQGTATSTAILSVSTGSVREERTPWTMLWGAPGTGWISQETQITWEIYWSSWRLSMWRGWRRWGYRSITCEVRLASEREWSEERREERRLSRVKYSQQFMFQIFETPNWFDLFENNAFFNYFYLMI